MLPTEFAQTSHVLNHAGFVMSQNYADQNHFVPRQLIQPILSQSSVGIDCKCGDPASLQKSFFRRSQCCRMFSGRDGDHAAPTEGESVNGGIDRFCSATCEDQFRRIGMQNRSDAFTAVFQNLSRRASKTVLTAGIRKCVPPAFIHPAENSGIQRSGRVVVKVDGTGSHSLV